MAVAQPKFLQRGRPTIWPRFSVAAMTMLFMLAATPREKSEPVRGECAHCGAAVYESLFFLDDAYAVWLGECPHCHALNFLSTKHGRGYSSAGMHLVLPTDDEVKRNGLPEGCPTVESVARGKAGKLLDRMFPDSAATETTKEDACPN